MAGFLELQQQPLVGVILVATPSWRISASSCTEWIRTSIMVPRSILPSAIRRWTNSMARSSRSSVALKLISVMRLMISVAECGSSSRWIGLMWTMIVSSVPVR